MRTQKQGTFKSRAGDLVGRDRLGRFVGDKYKKINGVWYKSKCLDCGALLKHQDAKRCKPCFTKVQVGPWAGKKRSFASGEKHWNWQGGKSSKAVSIRASMEYKLWRKAVFERDNYTCVWCRATRNLTADHIKPFSTHEKLRLEVTNGRTLCVSCHKKTPTWGRGALKYAS